MTYNKKQIELIHEFMQKRADIHEEMLWIGCNPSNPEMYKQQCEDGFKKMDELSRLSREYNKMIEDAGKKSLWDPEGKKSCDDCGRKCEFSLWTKDCDWWMSRVKKIDFPKEVDKPPAKPLVYANYDKDDLK